MKFAHLADCHIGGWPDSVLRNINKKYFEKAFDIIIKECVDFVLIAGDLFNSAVPSIDSIKLVIKQLKRLKDREIPVYFIAGSHDFSPSGKTMLDVLECAGFALNVSKGGEEIVVNDSNLLKLKIHVDKKTGVGITGLLGKKGGLEKTFYHNLFSEHFNDFDGFKIFMFHSALNELKPKELANMESFPLSLLPKGFDYYAGGHVHIVNQASVDGYNIVFPGPIFPNTFYELETLKKGGFFIIENTKAKFIELNDFPVFSFVLDCKDKNPSEVEIELKKLISGKVFEDAIITLRLKGELLTGRPSDINLSEIVSLLKDSGAYVILKNTSALTTKGFHSIKLEVRNIVDVETEIIKQHTEQNNFNDMVTESLIKSLSVEKHEGEKQLDFEKRFFSDVEVILEGISMKKE